MRFEKDVAEHLLESKYISIDPSCGSTHSMPGYAIYYRGEKVTSGTIKLDLSKELHSRLYRLSLEIQRICDIWGVSCLVYENVPPRRYGRGNATAHASLLKSVGTVLAARDWAAVAGLRPVDWTKRTGADYVKGDEQDAIEMGRIAYVIAQGLDTPMPRKPRKKKRRTKNGSASDKKGNKTAAK